MPPTEKRGRVHTSTITVAVLGHVTCDPRYDMREDHHFYEEWFSGTGNGGQNRNKNQNCLRLYHLPTGEVQTVQGKSRISNKSMALKLLIDKLDDIKKQVLSDDLNDNRQKLIGSGMRADKIRTYRFQDDQVNDHRTGKRTTCKKVMRGYFDDLWNK